MSAFKAKMVLDGKIYKLAHCSFDYHQNAQSNGKPMSNVMGGFITIVLEEPATKDIIQWAIDTQEKRNGIINFHEVNALTGTFQVLTFSDGFCVNFTALFDGDKHTAGKLVHSFIISAQSITYEGIELVK